MADNANLETGLEAQQTIRHSRIAELFDETRALLQDQLSCIVWNIVYPYNLLGRRTAGLLKKLTVVCLIGKTINRFLFVTKSCVFDQL